MSQIETATGRMFPLTAPTEHDIDIEDIAVALSRAARFGGMTSPAMPAMSVAQHSVRCSLMVPDEHALWGLLHDAAEAYIGDIPTPLKTLMADVVEPMETAILAAIAKRFGMPPEMPLSVIAADRVLLAAEAHTVMSDASWAPPMPHPQPAQSWRGIGLVRPLGPETARMVFRLRFFELTSPARPAAAG